MFQKHSNRPISGWLTFLFFIAELSRENFAHTNGLVTRLGGALELFAIADHVWNDGDSLVANTYHFFLFFVFASINFFYSNLKTQRL